MLNSRKDLSALIPHGENMVLVDQVLEWNEDNIHCSSNAHHIGHNYFIESEGLPANLLIEICAQTAAIHSALGAQQKETRKQAFDHSGPAYLAQVKNVTIASNWIKNTESSMHIKSNRLLNSGNGAIYETEITLNDALIFSAQLTLKTPV